MIVRVMNISNLDVMFSYTKRVDLGQVFIPSRLETYLRIQASEEYTRYASTPLLPAPLLGRALVNTSESGSGVEARIGKQ
jgi:hypothetical protein